MAFTDRGPDGRFLPRDDLADRVRQLEKESQKNSSDLAAHNDVCAERYSGIIAALGDLKKVTGEFAGSLQSITNAQSAADGFDKGLAEARKPKWWASHAATIAAAILGAVVAAWMGHQLAAPASFPPAQAAHASATP